MASLAVRVYRRGYGRSQIGATDLGPVIAFPGAEGFGSETRHAYEGSATPTVYKVTTLSGGSGAGTLRAALTASDPRIVVFEVSGWIDLASSPIAITTPYCYVAGQTAPSPGIGIKNGYVYVSHHSGSGHTAHDVVIRHLSVAPGPSVGFSAASTEYATYNVIWDHCSFFWHTDEGAPLYGRDQHDCSYSHCLVSEGVDIGDEASDGAGAFIAAGTTAAARMTRLSYVKNAFLHMPRRYCGYVLQQTESAWVNNLGYNPQNYPMTLFQGSPDNGPSATAYAALLGQVYIGGPNTPADAIAIVWGNYTELITGSQVYVSDTLVDPYASNVIDDFHNLAGYNPVVGSLPAELADITTLATVLSSSAVEAYISAACGSRPVERHTHDARMMTELAARTGSIKTTSTWGEGTPGTYPTLAENTASFTVPGNAHDLGSSGYTVLEELIDTYTNAVQ